MIDEITRSSAEGRRTVMILPVGPVGQYPIFVRLVNERRVDLSGCVFINMDEYLTDDGDYIDPASPLSFRGFMQRNVYSRIDPALLMPEDMRVFPDPRDPGAMDRLIRDLGGVDLAVGGIGINGHLAFNEPVDGMPVDQFAQLPTRVLSISRETRVANAIGDLGGAISAMPRLAVTIGMARILEARRVRLGVFRDWHRAVVRRAAYGDVTASFPVTLLQDHPDACVYVNRIAAAPAIAG